MSAAAAAIAIVNVFIVLLRVSKVDRGFRLAALRSDRELNMRDAGFSRSAFAHGAPYNGVMMKNDESKRAQEILKRIDDDQRSMIVQDTRGARIDESDRVEVWAKRIGRLLGYILLAILTVNLFTGWFF